MIQNRKLVFALAVVGSLTFASGCNSLSKMVKMAKEQELKVEPSPLEAHGNQVNFKMSAKLPVKMLKKDTEYTVKVSFVNEGAEEGKETFKKEVGNLTFVANDFLAKSKEEQPSIAKDLSFAYEPQYERGDLVVQGVASKKNKTKNTPQMPVAKGIITTSTLVKGIVAEPYEMGDKGDGTFAYLEHGYTEKPAEQVYVDFIFDKGSSALRTAEVRDKGKMIDAFVASKNIKTEDGKAVVNIKGSHSPEGAETINTNLANQRAKVMEDYYRKQMGKYNYKKEKIEIEFKNTSQVLDETTPEFLSLVKANGNLTSEQKSEVESVMNGEGDFVAKEMKLQKMPYYETLMNEVYPALRYARTDVFQGAMKKSDAEISTTAKKIVDGKAKHDALTEDEMLYAAHLSPDMTEKQAIYNAAIKHNDSHAAHNNLGVVYLENALKETAAKRGELVNTGITHLEMSKNKKETAEVNYNLALAYALQNKENESNTALNRAIEVGSTNPSTQKKLNSARGIMLIKMAKKHDDQNYVAADQYLSAAGNSNKPLYNKGLAQLLHRDFDKAMVSFDEAINAAPNDSWSHYAKAVTAARQGKEDVMVQSLKKAVELNSELRARALKDLEFEKYFNSANFKDAIR